jgi:hypothetical protein
LLISVDPLVGHKQITNEVYVNLVSEMMYPKAEFGPYGYSPEENRVSAGLCFVVISLRIIVSFTQYPFEKISTLGYLLNPLRNRTVFGKWTGV